MTSQEKVKELLNGSYVHAVHYPKQEVWVIINLPFHPDNVGADRIGVGATEDIAWDDALKNLTTPAETTISKKKDFLPVSFIPPDSCSLCGYRGDKLPESHYCTCCGYVKVPK